MSYTTEAIRGFSWTFLESFLSKILTFGISIVLARLLLPEDYGILGSMYFFIGLGTILIDAGLTQSLIKDQRTSEKEFSTVFFFNLALSVLLYVILFVSAPLISEFYEITILKSVIRIYGLTFLIKAFYNIHNTILIKKMNFKKLMYVNLIANIISGIVSIVLAYRGFGVWSLVWGAIALSTSILALHWFTSSWRPILVFDKESLKKHFSFGAKITLSGILNIGTSNLYYLIIVKYFTIEQTGYFQKAENIKNLPVQNFTNIINKVAFPLFSKMKEDPEKLTSAYKRLIRLVLFIMVIVMVILIGLSEDIFIILFTEKWLIAAKYFKIIACTTVLIPVQSYFTSILKVYGKSETILKRTMFINIIIIILTIIGAYFGLNYLLWSYALGIFIKFLLFSGAASALMNYDFRSQLKDFLPILCLGFVVYLTLTYFETILEINIIFKVGILSVLAGVQYFLLAYIFKLSSYKEIVTLINKRINVENKRD